MIISSEFWAAITGALVGAVASAVPSWLLARSAKEITLTRDLKDRKRVDHLAGTRLFLTLSKVGNDILSTRLQVENMLVSRPIMRDEESPHQRRLSVLSGKSQEPKNPFDDCDLAILANKEGIDLLNALEHLGRCYQTQIAIFADYCKAKESAFELYEQAESHEVIENGITKYQMEGRLARSVKVREAKAEVLALGCIESARENSKLVVKASKFYDQLVQGSLSELNLPRMNIEQALEKFPEFENGAGAS